MGVFLRVKLFAKPDLGEYIPAAVALSTGKFRYIGCLKSNDTLTIYLAEAISFFQFVLGTFLFFHNEPGSIVYLF